MCAAPKTQEAINGKDNEKIVGGLGRARVDAGMLHDEADRLQLQQDGPSGAAAVGRAGQLVHGD